MQQKASKDRQIITAPLSFYSCKLQCIIFSQEHKLSHVTYNFFIQGYLSYIINQYLFAYEGAGSMCFWYHDRSFRLLHTHDLAKSQLLNFTPQGKKNKPNGINYLMFYSCLPNSLLFAHIDPFAPLTCGAPNGHTPKVQIADAMQI